VPEQCSIRSVSSSAVRETIFIKTSHGGFFDLDAELQAAKVLDEI